ncbi:MAG: DUF3256 family protein [Bacteroidales bacterium]|jgi:hypothetical protein|nr:DUF3256 family protein [Bacteroidales bacterium]
MNYVKKYILVCICSFSAGLSAQNIADIFLQIPDDMLPFITREQRQELIDNAQNKRETTVQNRLNGASSIHKLTPDYLLLQAASASLLELKLLPVNEYYSIVTLIRTRCAPACDSEIQFFTTEWKPLKNNYFTFPPFSMFFSNDSCQDTMNSLDMHLVKLSLHENATIVSASLSIKEYLNKDEYSSLPCKPDTINYRWENNKFNIQNTNLHEL